MVSVLGSFHLFRIPGTVFDFPIIFGTSFDFRLYCPSWYYDAPFVLHLLTFFCTSEYFFVLLLLRPLAGEISNRYGTVTFIFALNYFDHRDKEFDQDFRHFTDSSVGKEP